MRTVGVNERGYRVGEDHQSTKYTDREVELVRRLREQGMTYPQISEKMEMPYWTVSRICRHERRACVVAFFKKVPT